MLTSVRHEFTGTVEEVGPAVKNFKKGDQVVSPFTVSWLAIISLSCALSLTSSSLECFYCKNGFSSRCEKSLLFGTNTLDGAQAEYVGRNGPDCLKSWTNWLIVAQVRVPLADGTVMKAPEEIADNALVLMADIFPTG